ncbi:MAG: hypothetical protein Kow0077_16160 [Anaerolineae bacterium]
MPTAALPPLATFTPRYTATPVPTATLMPTFTFTPSITPIPPTATDTPTPTPTPPVIGRVSTVQDAVNMREGPGITYAAILGVENNTDLVILAANEERTWYNVRLEDGTEGWIAANLIYVLPSPTPRPTNTAPGIVVQVSGTPLATALLGGLPVTATPSFTPAGAIGGSGIVRTPGTVTATPTVTPTDRPGMNIPTVTSAFTRTPTPVQQRTQTSTVTPTTASVLSTATPVTAAATAAATTTIPSSGTLPVRQGVDVLAYCEQFNEIPPPLGAGSTIDVFWGWVASTPDYIRDHVQNVIYEVRFDGRLLESWRQYAAPMYQQADGNWAQYWYVPVTEPLTPGTHTITYRVTWRAPIFDGYEQFGPGTPNEVDTGNCTITVR